MHLGRLRVLGLLLPLLAATACSGADASSTARRTDVAVQSYAAPAGAPEYCTHLANSLHVTRVPRAVGLLTARPRHVEAKLHVAAAAEELRAVRAEVGADGDLADALDGLVAALSSARTGPLTTSVLTSISSGLDDVGRLIQTSCDFPA